MISYTMMRGSPGARPSSFPSLPRFLRPEKHKRVLLLFPLVLRLSHNFLWLFLDRTAPSHSHPHAGIDGRAKCDIFVAVSELVVGGWLLLRFSADFFADLLEGWFVLRKKPS